MYKCIDCGHVFSDTAEWKEDYGEVLVGCPACFGACDEAVQCADCGEYFLADELNEGLCEECERVMDHERD